MLGVTTLGCTASALLRHTAEHAIEEPQYLSHETVIRFHTRVETLLEARSQTQGIEFALGGEKYQ